MNTTQLTDVQKKAINALKWFETKNRDSGESFYSLKDSAPQELKDMIRAAHDKMLPDDYKYAYVVDALEAVEAYEDIDNIESEIEADVYNSDLLKWLSSNLTRAEYVDEYVEEFGISGLKDFDLYKIISGGQYLERVEVFNVVRSFLEEK
jgi:hypothetical protein